MGKVCDEGLFKKTKDALKVDIGHKMTALNMDETDQGHRLEHDADMVDILRNLVNWLRGMVVIFNNL